MNIRILLICTGLLFILMVFIAAAETVKVAVNEAQGRSGPGSFYKLQVLIPEGTDLDVIEKKKSWGEKCEKCDKCVDRYIICSWCSLIPCALFFTIAFILLWKFDPPES